MVGGAPNNQQTRRQPRHGDIGVVGELWGWDVVPEPPAMTWRAASLSDATATDDGSFIHRPGPAVDNPQLRVRSDSTSARASASRRPDGRQRRWYNTRISFSFLLLRGQEVR